MTDRWRARTPTPGATHQATSVAEVVALYERWGADHYDEELSQNEHGLQTAALAVASGAPDDLVVAALLHDVGHLLALEHDAARAAEAAVDGAPGPSAPVEPTLVDLGHEAVGARYLAALFPPAVTAPISLHVRAKRYRCTVDEAYHDALSDGSRASLVRQGGRLDAAAIAAFERHPGFDAAVRLRGWDDQGKVDGLAVASFDAHEDRLRRVAAAHTRRG